MNNENLLIKALEELTKDLLSKQAQEDYDELKSETSPEFMEAMDDLKSYDEMYEAVSLFTSDMDDRVRGAFIRIITMNHMAMLELGQHVMKLEKQVKQLQKGSV